MRTAKLILAISAAAVAFTASARTVYDAGKALRQNCESGSYANPYTDANGGVWSYLAADSLSPFSGPPLKCTRRRRTANWTAGTSPTSPIPKSW